MVISPMTKLKTGQKGHRFRRDKAPGPADTDKWKPLPAPISRLQYER